jgi:4-carboxymuconolactone decarboxylase
MIRLSPVDSSRLTPEQKELYDSIVSGPRAKKRPSLLDEHGNLTGPFNAFVHNPVLGKHWSAIGETLRFKTRLDRRLFELAIIVIACHWRSGHEWAAHAKVRLLYRARRDAERLRCPSAQRPRRPLAA